MEVNVPVMLGQSQMLGYIYNGKSAFDILIIFHYLVDVLLCPTASQSEAD